MAHILGIGIATVDIINTVDDYPLEDSKTRALSQRISRGGNVTNTLVVLSQLEHQCSWGGVCVDEPNGRLILQDLASYGIDSQYCRLIANGKVPTSYILVNQRNGSRTIIHYRDSPEFTFTDFERIDLQPFDWIHFEGRQVDETAKMLARVRQVSPQIPISLEIEKPRPDVEKLFDKVDVLLFSKEFAKHYGHDDAISFLMQMRSILSASPCRLICAWGSEGGYALERDGRWWHSTAYFPNQVVDTLGAGDTFNAAIIDGLCRQQDLAVALRDACRLAGKKCGQIGFQGLSKF